MPRKRQRDGQGTLWDADAGRASRDVALERVGRGRTEWIETATGALRDVAVGQVHLDSEDVWRRLESWGVADPGERRTMGRVMRYGVEAAWIARDHTGNATARTRHLGLKTVYRSLLYRAPAP
jgi:hypothetical protein